MMIAPMVMVPILRLKVVRVLNSEGKDGCGDGDRHGDDADVTFDLPQPM